MTTQRAIDRFNLIEVSARVGYLAATIEVEEVARISDSNIVSPRDRDQLASKLARVREALDMWTAS